MARQKSGDNDPKKLTVGDSLKIFSMECPQEFIGKSMHEDFWKEIPEIGPNAYRKLGDIIQKVTAALSPDYGTPNFKFGKSMTIYEAWPLGDQDPLHPGNTEERQLPGIEFTLAFPSGQKISMNLSRDGEVIERTYVDRGNIHTDAVVKFIRGWQKAIEQAQHGGSHKTNDWLRWETAYEISKGDKIRTDQVKKTYIEQYHGTPENAVNNWNAHFSRLRKLHNR
jgi:hypothetical protein